MTTPNGPDRGPLWLAIEEKILGLGSVELAGDGMEKAVHQVAGALDTDGFEVSKNAGHMLAIRGALTAREEVGRSMMEDLNKAFAALTLEKLANPYSATVNLINEVGGNWPALKESVRRAHVFQILEKTKLDLLVAQAKELGGDQGIRLLIGEDVEPGVIVERMEVSQEEYDRVLAAVEAEKAERARVAELLEGVADKSEAGKVRHLLTNDVSEDLILEMAAVDQAAIDGVKMAMEEEMAEKQRLAEEAAAKKAAEAAGPALEDITPDDMLDHIEAIREIMDFSDVESEIRTMCEQSSVPKALVDIAISDPDRLDELEAEAEG